MRKQKIDNKTATLRWLTTSVVALVIFTLINTPATRLRQAVWAQALLITPKIVVLDPGHGGIDTGAAGIHGVTEKDVTLPVCRHLQHYLTSSGARVILTRETDQELSKDFEEDLRLRVDRIGQNRAGVFISVHGNSFPGAGEYGAQTFFYHNHHDSERLARCVQAELKKLQPFGDNYREIQYGDFYVLRNSTVPAILVEIGFLSNPKEEQLLADPSYQKELAWHLFSGLIAFWRDERVPGEFITPVDRN